MFAGSSVSRGNIPMQTAGVGFSSTYFHLPDASAGEQNEKRVEPKTKQSYPQLTLAFAPRFLPFHLSVVACVSSSTFTERVTCESGMPAHRNLDFSVSARATSVKPNTSTPSSNQIRPGIAPPRVL